jgi:hypothetical protein
MDGLAGNACDRSDTRFGPARVCGFADAVSEPNSCAMSMAFGYTTFFPVLGELLF